VLSKRFGDLRVFASEFLPLKRGDQLGSIFAFKSFFHHQRPSTTEEASRAINI